jgi:hypothetical protein
MLDRVWMDVVVAARALRRRPGVTAAAVATLALGRTAVIDPAAAHRAE